MEKKPVETKKEPTKKRVYLPKDNLFGQVVRAVDRKAKKLVETEVDYRIITFKSGKIKFVKGQEVSKSDLAIMSDYQKEYYLK